MATMQAKKKAQKKMRIHLNNQFYKKEAIKNTIELFNDICGCKIIDDSFEIELNSNPENEQRIAGEFCNFVLGITKDKMLF